MMRMECPTNGLVHCAAPIARNMLHDGLSDQPSADNRDNRLLAWFPPIGSVAKMDPRDRAAVIEQSGHPEAGLHVSAGYHSWCRMTHATA